jgi:hypothetical protein
MSLKIMIDTLIMLDSVETATVNIVRNRLKSLEKRKRNWDHQGGIPAPKEIMENAVTFLEMVIEQYKPLPTKIWMTPLGEIVFNFPDDIWVKIEENDVVSWSAHKMKQDEIFDRTELPTVFERL